MANEVFKRDPNHIPVVAGVTDDASEDTSQLRVDPVTRRLKVDASLETGDIEIGAVEIKDGTTDNRAVVNAAGRLMVDATTGTITVTGAVNITAPTMIRGADVTVGTTPVELTFTGTTMSISIKAASTNTGIIYVGTSTVLSDGTNAIAELTADSAISFDYNDGDLAVYVVASVAAQKIYKMGLTP
jgi:hypothetical protein